MYQNYIHISPRLAKIGVRWFDNCGEFWLAPPDCFSKLTLWG